jgi:hypothetical protein
MPLFLHRNLGPLAALAARDATPYSANALRVQDPGDGSYRVEVTDGRRLAVVRGPCPQAEYPALGATPHAAADVLVPVTDWKAGFRLGGRQRPVGLAADDSKFTLAVGDQAVAGACAGGRFPDFAAVLPKRPAPFGFRVNPELLAGLLLAAAALDPAGGVWLLLYGPDAPVGVACHNDAGQFFDGLIVPLT